MKPRAKIVAPIALMFGLAVDSAEPPVGAWAAVDTIGGTDFTVRAERPVPWKGKNETFKLRVGFYNEFATVAVHGPFGFNGQPVPITVEFDGKSVPQKWNGGPDRLFAEGDLELIARLLDTKSLRIRVSDRGGPTIPIDFTTAGLRSISGKAMAIWFERAQAKKAVKLPTSLDWLRANQR